MKTQASRTSEMEIARRRWLFSFHLFTPFYSLAILPRGCQSAFLCCISPPLPTPPLLPPFSLFLPPKSRNVTARKVVSLASLAKDGRSGVGAFRLTRLSWLLFTHVFSCRRKVICFKYLKERDGRHLWRFYCGWNISLTTLTMPKSYIDPAPSNGREDRPSCYIFSSLFRPASCVRVWRVCACALCARVCISVCVCVVLVMRREQGKKQEGSSSPGFNDRLVLMLSVDANQGVH